jgi:hypothetical protein
LTLRDDLLRIRDAKLIADAASGATDPPRHAQLGDRASDLEGVRPELERSVANGVVRHVGELMIALVANRSRRWRRPA